MFDVSEFIDLPQDVSYILDDLGRRFPGIANVRKSGIIGHSFSQSPNQVSILRSLTPNQFDNMFQQTADSNLPREIDLFVTKLNKSKSIAHHFQIQF